ncbi:MAG: succinylglutamate desuccinylase/aspartoacylase family protein [Candidatus Thermoplasmatota archaeon]|nr:succinylglutamate desuccinylase/aspartoacylase family protein [Candidatus Thermoplasmatota archaeon]
MKKTLVTAGIHGAEIGSVLIAREIKGWVESRDIKEVEVIPEVNLEAVENKQRENPEDGKDLNRIFPGDKKGTKSELIAHRIFQKAKDYDQLIDLHTYGKNSWCVPYMLTDLNKDYNRELCEKIGLENAVQTGGTGGQLFIETSNLEIPSMIIEAGGAERYRDELEMVKKHVLSFIFDEKFEERQNEAAVSYYEYYERIRPDHKGYFEPKKEPGDHVEEGEEIGTLAGEIVNTPFSGFILGMKMASEYKPEKESVAAVARKEK